MKTIKQTVAQSSLGGGNYQTPEVAVTELYHEGPLCMSGKSFEEWEKASVVTWDE